jgi:predicted nucleotidyltransferase
MAKRARKPSGRFLLRLPPALHATLRRAADAAGLSLNDYCSRRLAAPAGSGTALLGGAAAIERAVALLGDRLLGVVAYGSWARGQLADASDVDVLVVAAPGVALTRALYRAWDEAPVSWDGRPVEPHFVVLTEDQRPGAVWAEAAIDGIVVFERELRVSRRLVQVRHDILAGRLVRRLAHGQPYWTEVA